MKKLAFIPSILLALIFVSCDKVDYPDESSNNNNDSTDGNIYVRKVLLEDYTGHKCGNCPAAAIVAENLYKQYNGKVVTIAVHAGFFAKTSSTHPTSYTTTAGNDWDGSAGFGVSAVGNPNGMVNRKNYAGNGLIQKESKWPTTVSLALNDTYILGLEIKPSYDVPSRMLNTSVIARFKTSYPNNVKFNLVLIEDSIIGPQTDYSKSPDYVPNYVFMHMLRESINGTWGSNLKVTPIAPKDSVSVSFPNFAIKTGFNDKHLYLVAFAYDATNKEVLQVEKVKMR
ncbi:MAG: Omp28 family outer membrane lipoprotein [Bacteroidota bacterium]|nr:Omp28 family outer membrane lipoprotein [Bacteroidota bacterium]